MAGGVWVGAQLGPRLGPQPGDGGELHRGTLEAVAFAQQLSQAVGKPALAAVVGDDVSRAAETLASFRLEAVHRLEHPSLAAYSPLSHAEALARVLGPQQPTFVVLPHTYQTVDFLPRLATLLDGALVPEVIAFRVEGDELRFQRPVMQGKMLSEVRVRQSPGPICVSVQSGAISTPPEEGEAPIEVVAPGEAEGLAPERELVRIEAADGGGVDLSTAEVVVAVGRGVGEAEKLGPIRELAAAVGGELGASRPVVDSGWLPRELQIGSSGQTVAPRLYFAIGISGAIQHLVGMRGAQCVVAINKDASAPIFRIARYGIVGDLHEIVPALLAALRAASE